MLPFLCTPVFSLVIFVWVADVLFSLLFLYFNSGTLNFYLFFRFLFFLPFSFLLFVVLLFFIFIYFWYFFYALRFLSFLPFSFLIILI